MLELPKGFNGNLSLQRSRWSTSFKVGGLAVFLLFSSWLLISYPGSSTPMDRPRKRALALLGINLSRNPLQLQRSSIDSSVSGLALASNEAGQLLEHTHQTVPANGSLATVMSKNIGKISPNLGNCNLYHGKWIYDSSGPLYSNNTCPVLSQTRNCWGNGRPDRDYENWRWKPAQCDLPRFDAKKFLELMRGKTLAFIGDSIARNHMESLLCMLWQTEAPKNTGDRKIQRWYFNSTSVTIIRIWSAWLVHKTMEPFQFAPKGIVKLHLNTPDEDIMNFLPNFDVLVLSFGHWFVKQSVYIANNEIVGGQLWWPDQTRQMKINNVEAFSISVETILTAIVTHPNYTGLTIVRSYSPDHYGGKICNIGGSCTGKIRPAFEGELSTNKFTETMHEKQVTGFKKAIKKATNKSKLRFMDITEAFGYRFDGHPGPYSNPDPNKQTKHSPNGMPPPQDCLHWCLPGPVDTWNELLLEIVRREIEGVESLY